jgi:hypothetical protein
MHTHIALAWIKDAKRFLEDHLDPILSDIDTCGYFRQKLKKAPKKVDSPPLPPPLAAIKKESPPLMPLSKPAPAPPAPQIFAAFPKIELPQEPPKKKENLSANFRSLFAKIAPETAILPEIPSDTVAKKIATRWKTKNQIAPITVIFYQENPEQKQLLEQIAKALDVYFGPATLLSAETIERENEWKTFLSATELKLVIACDYTLWQLQNLCPFYKEIPAKKTRQLGEKLLFMLPDLSLYLKDPLLKRSLWKALCQTISSLPSPSIKN